MSENKEQVLQTLLDAANAELRDKDDENAHLASRLAEALEGKSASTDETTTAIMQHAATKSGMKLREAVRDVVADNLRGLYYCGRVWSAWSVGTMGEDDFSPAEYHEDIISNIVDAVIAAISAAPAKPEPAVDGDAGLTALDKELMPKRAAFLEFCKPRALDVSECKDAWGNRTFVHSHVEAMWYGWFNAPAAPVAQPLAPSGAVPEGFALLPVKPDMVMTLAGRTALNPENHCDCGGLLDVNEDAVYMAMVNAAMANPAAQPLAASAVPEPI